MNPGLAYVLGVSTLPLVGAVVAAWITAIDTGKSIECRACGYCTGDLYKTKRIVTWTRWRWHRLTTGHHSRRWNRELDRLGVPR